MTFPGLIDDKQALAEDVPTSVCFAQNAAKLRHQLADSAIRVGVHHSALAEVQSLHERRGLCQVNGVRRMGINQMGYLIRAISQRHPDSTQTVARLGKLVADGGLAVSDVFVVTVLDVLNRVRAGRFFFPDPMPENEMEFPKLACSATKCFFLWPHNLKI